MWEKRDLMRHRDYFPSLVELAEITALINQKHGIGLSDDQIAAIVIAARDLSVDTAVEVFAESFNALGTIDAQYVAATSRALEQDVEARA